MRRRANRIAEMAGGINKQVYYVLNKVKGEAKDVLLGALDPSRIIAAVSQDEAIFRCSLEGKELDLDVEGVEELADFLCGLKSQAGAPVDP